MRSRNCASSPGSWPPRRPLRSCSSGASAPARCAPGCLALPTLPPAVSAHAPRSARTPRKKSRAPCSRCSSASAAACRRYWRTLTGAWCCWDGCLRVDRNYPLAVLLSSAPMSLARRSFLCSATFDCPFPAIAYRRLESLENRTEQISQVRRQPCRACAKPCCSWHAHSSRSLSPRAPPHPIPPRHPHPPPPLTTPLLCQQAGGHRPAVGGGAA